MKKTFWTEMTKLLDQYTYEKDLIKKMMKMQEINNDRHVIDYRMIKKEKTFNGLSGGLDDKQIFAP